MVALLRQTVQHKWLNPLASTVQGWLLLFGGKFLCPKRQPYFPPNYRYITQSHISWGQLKNITNIVVPLAHQNIRSHFGILFCTSNPQHHNIIFNVLAYMPLQSMWICQNLKDMLLEILKSEWPWDVRKPLCMVKFHPWLTQSQNEDNSNGCFRDKVKWYSLWITYIDDINR